MNAQDTVAEHSTVEMELRPVDNSDQPLLANFVAVQAASGLVYLDFGFLDLPAMKAMARLAGGDNNGHALIRGKLACRVALPADAVANLALQLNQYLQPAQTRTAAHEAQVKEQSLH